MIPILYTAYETDFTSNGFGRLADCSFCKVTEERNGIYECEFKYPITGKWYNEMITNGGCVAVIHDDNHDIQPFDIYKHSAPIDGLVTFYAHHISYRLNRILVKPFTASNVVECFTKIIANSANNNPFNFTTDKLTQADFELTHPDTIRGILGGSEGSVLDMYGGGEYKWDVFDVYLLQNRGTDTDVTIRYGKNLTQLTHDIDNSSTYSAIAPYWIGSDGTIVYLPEVFVTADDVPIKTAPWTDENGNYITDDNGEIIYFQYENIQPFPMDLSNYFDEQPSEADLRQMAKTYLSNNKPWLPTENTTIDFVELWQTPEYENVAALQQLHLCDTVSVFYPELGVVSEKAKIIKVVYNVLDECFDSMEIGQLQTTLAEVITTGLESFVAKLPTKSVMQAAIEHATKLLAGGLGGHVVFGLNLDGEPEEILIMDTDDKDTAVNVIRMNMNGIGFSTTGYEGPFTTAWTIDGAFVADFITSGTMLADRIKGGTLEVGGVNDESGVINILDSIGNRTGGIDKNGIEMFAPGVYHSLDGNDYNYTAYAEISGESISFSSDVAGESLVINSAPHAYNNSWTAGTSLFMRGYGLYMFGYRGSGWDSAIEISANLAQMVVRYNTIFTEALVVQGTKSRLSDADDYGKRLLYSYETPSPMFGDVGEGVIDEYGMCYVFLDPVFAETISTNQYQVFLQKYGQGECYVAERKADHFVVVGEPGLSFGWELKAKQKDFDQLRLDRQIDQVEQGVDYGGLGADYFISLEEGRIA